MEFERRELRDDGRGDSFYASSSSAARYPSDAGLSRYGIRALGSSSQSDQVRQLSYNTDSTFLETRRRSGPPGPSLQDPLPAPTYHEDLELEICRGRLREVADRIELAHFRMLEAHDRRALAIAEQSAYARRIPFYPELPPDNGQINNTAQGVLYFRSPQRVPGERSEVQKDLNVGPDWGPRAGVAGPPILRREEVLPHVGLDGARSHYQSIGPVEAVCPVGPARDVRIDERSGHDPILQNQFTGYNMMLPPQIIHELPPPLVVPVPVPVPTTENKIGSSADTNKKRKKEYGLDVVQVKPTMRWSKWPCVWCSVNFDSKEAMDVHFKEQHQGCKGDGPSKSEKVENNRNDEIRTGLTVMSDGDQEISELSGPRTNKNIRLYLSPANLKRKSNKLQKGDAVPTLQNKEVAGWNTNKKIKLEIPPFNLKRKSDEANNEEVEPTPEDKEIAGSSTIKKIKLYLPPLNLRQILNELVQTPEDKEIAGSSINRKMKLDLSPSNLKQITIEPSKEEVVPIPENKEKPDTGAMKPGWVVPEDGWFCDLCKINTLTEGTLDDHFQSSAHLEKLNALPNGSQKSEPASKIVAEKPVQGVSQAVLVPELDEQKEKTSKSTLTPQSDKLKEVSQAVSVPELEKQKEKTSKSILMPQSDKLKEVSSQDKGIPSSSDRTVIMKDHKKTAQPAPKFSKKKNGAPVNGITKPVLVMKDGKWFCNLCGAKQMDGNVKEEHIKGKRHRMNLQSAKLHWCSICNICCTSENSLIAHFNGKKHREQNQGCKGDGPSESEKDENNRNEETYHGTGRLSEVSGTCTNKKIQLELPPFNFKRKSDEANKEEVEPNPEDKEIVGSSTTKKIKLELPQSNSRQIPNELVQTPENKEIARSSTNRNMKLDLPPLNLKQKPDEPSKEEVVPIPDNKEKPATGTTEPGWVVPEDGRFCKLCKINSLTERTLDEHLHSDAHLEKLIALLNGSQKSEPANKIEAAKPVHGVSQAVSMPKLEEAKEETSRSIPMRQLYKLKEAASQDKGNPSSSNKMVVLTGHKKPAQRTPKFSNKKNGVPVNGITKPVLVMKDGKWFCKLCETKGMTENAKENHIKGKRHWMNLQSQAVSHTPEPNKPSAKLHWCSICSIYCTNENDCIAHINGKKHREASMKQTPFA